MKKRELSLTHDGETHCLAEWARRSGISYALLHNRISGGATIGEAMAMPLHPNRIRHSYAGKSLTLAEWARLTGIPDAALRRRLSLLGWTIEQALTIPTPTQRRAGVVSNLPKVLGTGGGSTAQERAEIEFSQDEVSA